MVLFKVWTHKLSLSVGILVIAIALLWPSIPLKSLAVWWATLTSKFPTNVLYPLFTVLIGSYAALYTYDRWVAKCCRVNAAKTAAPSVLGVFLGACPACIPVIAFFLPLSVTITLGYYSWLFLLGSIALILYSIWRAGGFQRISNIPT